MEKSVLRRFPETLAYPHPLNRRRHIRHSEPDGLAHFEVGDEAGHAPVVELAAADFEMAGKFLFGDQVEFGARRGWVRVHARCCRVNSTRTDLSSRSGDKW